MKNDLIERLEDVALEKARSSFDCAGCGVEANLVNEVIEALSDAMEHCVPPERRFTHWRGDCGHEWLKSQSKHCPYCELDRADKRIEELSAPDIREKTND